MPAAPPPADEAARLSVLRSYGVLDAPADPVLDDMTRLAARIAGTPIGLVSLLDRDRQWFMARHGIERRETPRSLAFCGHAILDPSRVLVVPDAAADSRFADNALVNGAPHIRFYAGTPLLGPERQPLGTLCVIGQEPRPFSGEQAESLEILGRAVVTTLELHRSLARMRNLAMTDPLTGLANRRALEQHLVRVIAAGERDRRPFALLLLDLDGFKAVNDREGHAAGDRLLQAAAGVLAATLRGTDTIARIGGDEFAVVLDTRAVEETAAAAERLRVALAGHAVHATANVTVSIGAAIFKRPPVDPAAALAAADAELYAAKRAGRNCVRCNSGPAALAA